MLSIIAAEARKSEKRYRLCRSVANRRVAGIRNLSSAKSYRHGPVIDLAEKLLEIAPVPMSKI